MMRERLNDAAIALHRVLSGGGVKFGLFGGYAVGVMGGERATKDIDCLASASKDQVVELLHKKDGFVVIPQTRQDYVAFFWDDQAEGRDPVLVEIFCEKFPGSTYSMDNVECCLLPVEGRLFGQDVSSFLDPFYLFKGKLHATAVRSTFRDSADIRTLEYKHGPVIKPRVKELSLEDVGLSIRQYPELELSLGRLGVDLDQAKQAAKHIKVDLLQVPPAGDVQRGVLA
ncbi:hypothetical protein F4677DRAFT_450205 [Hypoxylon crocopeplum]|nr:hypothetical protein F4677DRAFT_450205 [Hypoxylon crocopeplum]